MRIDKATFDKTYDEAVLGRSFVEFPDYYEKSRSRFWQSFHEIDKLGLPEGSTALDIGGGIMAVLMQKLLGFRAAVGDVNTRSEADIRAAGLDFAIVDLFSDKPQTEARFDLVILQEVIEHIPQPPYLVLKRIEAMMKPGGMLFLTTPNGHRFRNVAYMIAGKEILDRFRYPEEGEALGHQHEYTMAQMRWQADRAGMNIQLAEYYEDNFGGASLKARIAWLLARPARMIPHMKNGIMMVLRSKPIEA